MKCLEDSTVPPETKRRGRKPKKMAQKELLNMFYEETGIPESKGTTYSKKTMECYKYLSPAEKQGFELGFTVPKNANQERYLALLNEKARKIIVVSGPAGTGKTLFATEYGIRHFLMGTYEKLIFTRPSVSVDEDIGYLPGSLEEKMAPWVRPIYDILYPFISPKDVKQYMEDKTIEIAPLGYMRGRTFKNAWIVADEMQNSTVSQMKMLMTRLGENSRMVITGDLEQYDRQNEVNGLDDFLRKFNDNSTSASTAVTTVPSSIVVLSFEKKDIQREEVVKEVLDIYSGREV